MQLEGREINRYRILSLIGHGAMGDVFLAEDPRIQQQVALKVLEYDASLDQRGGTGDTLSLFRDEARAIARLRHPRIVHLNDYDEVTIDGTTLIYLVTPYYKDGSLAKWVQQLGTTRLSLEDITHLISQAADALQYAHNFQIVHRDVKPSNFLIDTEGIANPTRPNLLLTDFGIAKFTAGSTASAGQNYLGGLAYMAPEQFNGQFTYASDQYGLAITAYELLTGHPPFQGAPQVIMRQQFDTQPDPPGAVNPDVPKAIDNVILRALAKNPEDRFGSVEAFSTAFQQKRSGPVGPKAPPVGQQAVPPVGGPVGQQRVPPVGQQAVPPVSRPRGNDVRATLVINAVDAQRGTNGMLYSPGGQRINVPVPPNAYNGMVLHLKGLGEPSPAGGQPGDLYVTINISQPQPAYPYPYPPAPPPAMAQPQLMAQPSLPVQQSNRTLWLVVGIIVGIVLVGIMCVVLLSL